VSTIAVRQVHDGGAVKYEDVERHESESLATASSRHAGRDAIEVASSTLTGDQLAVE
jgi:hypothetical protein